MRQFLSILLLAVLGLPVATPLFAMSAKTESNLPACCRKNGKHHCTMTMEQLSQLAGKNPQFHAPADKCPYCPTAAAVVHGDTFVPVAQQAIYAGLIAHPAVAAQTESKFRISRGRSRQKRGPPALAL